MKNNYSRLKWVALIIIGGVLFFLSKAANAATTTPLPLQQQEVSGVVEDQNGLPIPGVTVTVKNTNRGTVTNLDGAYNIIAPANGTLVFSYIGFKTVEIPVDNNEEISIQLEEDVSALGEVKINAGYYNTTERERTGNISRVTAEEIELQPVVSPIQALAGRMAGVEVTSGGSHPGMAPTIKIRGTNSLREEGNYPLYIIDGVPINSTPVESNSLMSSAGIDPLNNLDVSNIESIEVLKDADATAIYGSRGANGVILITTKKGREIGTSVKARFYTGMATVPNRWDLLNTEEYLEIRRAAFENDGVEPTERNAYDLLLWDQDRYTDWQEFLYGGTSETTNANITFSGGNETTSFRFGSSYYTQGTVYPGDYDYRKVTGNLNLNHRSGDNKFNLSLSLNYGVDTNNLVGNVGFNATTAFLPPNAPEIFNNDGSLAWEEWGVAGLDNPLEGYFNTSNTQTNNFISNLTLSYEIFPALRFKTSMGYSYYDSKEMRKQPSQSYNPADETPNNSSHLSAGRKSWILEPQILFEKSFNNLKIDAIVGATFQENIQNQEGFRATGYASEALIGNIAAAESIINARRESAEYKYAALFSRIGINWDRKYYINLTGRRDGSSRFGPNNRFANFGAVGTAWIFTEENFIKEKLPFLSFGKLRGSYGTTGNDQIGDYGYLNAYEATDGPGGLYPTGLANPNYSWEVNKKLEVGLEIGLFEERIRAGFSRYRNRSSNQLVGYPLPEITGFTSVQANLPATVENSGWEFEFSSLNIDSKEFRWQTSLNVSLPKNELVNYPDIDQSSYANTYRVGYPLNISLLFDYTGLDPETGFYTVRDVNEDGSFDYQDRIIIQDLNRELFGGINNSFSFKNFNLQFLWEFVMQEGLQTSFDGGTVGNSRSVALATLAGESVYQKISQSAQARTAYGYAINTSIPVEDASFVRLKTITLNYNLPKAFTRKFGMENWRLFLHGQNLLTFSEYSGMDPERTSSGIGNLRTISAGLEINF